jgi:hypothetical protein
MNLRELILLMGSLMMAVWPLRLKAQQRTQPALVGIFVSTDTSGRSIIPAETDAFYQAMRPRLCRGAKRCLCIPPEIKPSPVSGLLACVRTAFGNRGSSLSN